MQLSRNEARTSDNQTEGIPMKLQPRISVADLASGDIADAPSCRPKIFSASPPRHLPANGWLCIWMCGKVVRTCWPGCATKINLEELDMRFMFLPCLSAPDSQSSSKMKRTGRSFSLEANRREGVRPRIVRPLNDALSKHANHPRVIFVDSVNLD